jgi:hypothetical protein
MHMKKSGPGCSKLLEIRDFFRQLEVVVPQTLDIGQTVHVTTCVDTAEAWRIHCSPR